MTRRPTMAERVETRLIAIVRVFLGLGLISMVLLNVANAVGRYGGFWSLTGADEALVYGMIWIVMLGAILATRARDHLVIDLLPAVLPPLRAAQLRILTDAATAGVCFFVAWYSWSFIERIGAIGATSMGLGIPLVLPHAAILVGFVGMGIVSTALALFSLIASGANAAPEGRQA